MHVKRFRLQRVNPRHLPEAAHACQRAGLRSVPQARYTSARPDLHLEWLPEANARDTGYPPNAARGAESEEAAYGLDYKLRIVVMNVVAPRLRDYMNTASAHGRQRCVVRLIGGAAVR